MALTAKQEMTSLALFLSKDYMDVDSSLTAQEAYKIAYADLHEEMKEDTVRLKKAYLTCPGYDPAFIDPLEYEIWNEPEEAYEFGEDE